MNNFFALSGKYLLLFIFLSFFPLRKQNSVACQVYKKNLAIIKARLDDKKDINLMNVYGAILFFERLTDIRSHSPGGAAGQFDPTNEDYINWSNWFNKNQSKLYWDHNQQKVKIEDKKQH